MGGRKMKWSKNAFNHGLPRWRPNAGCQWNSFLLEPGGSVSLSGMKDEYKRMRRSCSSTCSISGPGQILETLKNLRSSQACRIPVIPVSDWVVRCLS